MNTSTGLPAIRPAFTFDVLDIPYLRRTLLNCQDVEYLNLTIPPVNDSTPPDDIVTLTALPTLVNEYCPRLKELKVIYNRPCSLWEFAESIAAYLGMNFADTYDFFWGGEVRDVLGFMGDFKSQEKKDDAWGKLLRWKDVYGTKRIVNIRGLHCSCEVDNQECPNPEACATLREFLSMGLKNQIRIYKWD